MRRVHLTQIIFLVLLGGAAIWLSYAVFLARERTPQVVLVTTAPLQFGNLTHMLTFSGVIEPKTKQSIAAPSSGYISFSQLHTGKRIRKGELLLALETTLGPLLVNSPLSGHLTEVSSLIQTGNWLPAGTLLATITSIHKQVKGWIPEWDLSSLHLNQAAEISGSSEEQAGPHTARGIVSQIGPEMETVDNLSKLPITLQANSLPYPLGFPVRIQVKRLLIKNSWKVVSTAIQETPTGNCLYAVVKKQIKTLRIRILSQNDEETALQIVNEPNNPFLPKTGLPIVTWSETKLSEGAIVSTLKQK